MALLLEEKHALLGGQVSYREIVKINWLREELVSTETACARLAKWSEAGRPSPDPKQLTFVGDREIGLLARLVLEKLPPPVVDHVVRTSAVFGVGVQSAGWHAYPPSLPVAVADGLSLICVSGAGSEAFVAGVIAHEMAHAWLEAPPAPSSTDADQHEARLLMLKLAEEWGELQRLGRMRGLVEGRAARLCWAWGFTGPAADVRFHVRSGQQSVSRELAWFREDV